MARNQNESPSPPSSLNFLSTQIQSRYEVQESRDSDIARLQRFHNSPTQTKPNFVTKKAKVSRKKQTKTQKKNKITLLSAFVRDLLSKKKPIDTHSILDYFKGEKDCADEFISILESLTASPFSKSSAASELALFTGQEWRVILDTLRLKYPNLSAPKKKSLKIITKRLEAIREQETSQGLQEPEGLQNLWSQASNQPNEDLTTEDLKWLYDLDEEQLLHNTSIDIQEESSQQPFCFTLSQMLRDSSQHEDPPSSPILDDEPTIDDSEPELEPFSELEIQELLRCDIDLQNTEDPQSQQRRELLSTPMGDQNIIVPEKDGIDDLKELYSSQSIVEQPVQPSNTMKVPLTTMAPRQDCAAMDSIDIVTSIMFAPTGPSHPDDTDTKQQYITSSSVVEIDSPSVKRANSSPIGSHIINTSQDWPSDVIIDSSPIRQVKPNYDYETIFQKRSLVNIEFSNGGASPEHKTVSPSKIPKEAPKSPSYVKRETWNYEKVECMGHISLRASSDPNISLRKFTVTLPDDVVPDSEEENEITVVEVGYLEKPKIESVLQVVSSP